MTMELLTGNAIFTIICALAIISSVNSQCCDFEATMCSWDLGLWTQSSATVKPDLASYPTFATTQPSEIYLYLQDKPGSMTSITPFTISAEGTLISFDYFFNSPTANPKDYFQLYFANIDTAFSVLLATVPGQDGSWRHLDLQCDSTNSYCCGSSTEIPCQGTLQLAANVDNTDPISLYAIDNIGFCGPATTTESTTAGSTTTGPTGGSTTTGPTGGSTTTGPTGGTTTTGPTGGSTTTGPTGVTTATGTTAATTTPAVSPTGTEDTTTEGTTGPTVPTLPPPVPSDCCQFETDICGITNITNWYWSSQEVPPSNIPSHSGEYFWTNDTGAHFSSSPLTGVTPDTAFSINYYINSDVKVIIHFKPSTQTAVELVTLTQTGEAFESYTATCGSTCCGGATCDGQAYITIEASTGLTDDPAPLVVAVDNIERDSACRASMPCCYFDDVYMCGFNNSASGLYAWKFDGDSPPFTEIPHPGSNYVYLEMYNYFGPDDVNVILASHDMVIDNTVVFKGSLYVSFQLTTDTGSLSVNFVNADTGKSVQLDYVTDTQNAWKTFEFSCDSAHGSCCPSADKCTGHVEIIASAPGTMGGGTAVYAVDAFEIDTKCTVFPGHNAKESNSKRAIKFQPTLV